MNKSVKELLSNPLCRPEDLGKPLPGSPHAVSVCLPTWKDNIGYEEGEERVRSALKAGYPRFVLNPLVAELFSRYEKDLCREGEFCRIFPSEGSASRCLNFVRASTGFSGKTHDIGLYGLHAAVLPESCRDLAHLYWQHSGEIVSSRLAESILNSKPAKPTDEGKTKLKNRLAELYGIDESDVFLFPSGMAAIYCINRIIWRLFPGRRSVQYGFPYVDTLKIQQNLGPGADFYPSASVGEFEKLKHGLKAGDKISALFTEFPSNPLLSTPDLGALKELSLKYKFPIVVDDTLSTCLNANLLSVGDAITTSLTKYFSGGGDVIGGMAALNPSSPFYDVFALEMKREYEDLLWFEDAQVLENNSKSFEDRMDKINKTCETVADFLTDHPCVAKVYHPKTVSRKNYEAYKKPNGGFGGLLSFTLKNEAETAPTFFDALQVSKGPNLGTAFSLCCPYTILAHYKELKFVRECGLSKHLIRLSVGVEPPGVLIERIEKALSGGR